MSPDDIDTLNAKDTKSEQPANALLNSITTVAPRQIQMPHMVVASFLGIDFSAAVQVSEPTPAAIPTTQVTPAQQLIVDHGAVRLGRTYAAQFSPNMVYYELVFRTFTGAELFDSTAKHSNLVDASPLVNQADFKRMTVSLKTPW